MAPAAKSGMANRSVGDRESMAHTRTVYVKYSNFKSGCLVDATPHVEGLVCGSLDSVYTQLNLIQDRSHSLPSSLFIQPA